LEWLQNSLTSQRRLPHQDFLTCGEPGIGQEVGGLGLCRGALRAIPCLSFTGYRVLVHAREHTYTTLCTVEASVDAGGIYDDFD